MKRSYRNRHQQSHHHKHQQNHPEILFERAWAEVDIVVEEVKVAVEGADMEVPRDTTVQVERVVDDNMGQDKA